MERSGYLSAIMQQMAIHPVVGILGPRQCGKTTLAHRVANEYAGPIHRFDLEDPQDLAALSAPMIALQSLEGLVVVDEIQRLPSLFPILRVLVDRKLQDPSYKNTHFLILGSSSRDLIQQSTETLAGRIGYIELTPFRLHEGCKLDALWLRGGYPLSYLAKDDNQSFLWRKAYVKTFLERDIPQLGFNIPSGKMQRCWMMLAHLHTHLLNKQAISVALGVSNPTVQNYLDILTGTFMMRTLMPWFENIKKRQVKSPKLYFRDSGLLLSLLHLDTRQALLQHPALGAIWEGFALEQLIQALQLDADEVFFWRTQDGAELDLFFMRGGKRLGFEFKFADAPRSTKSMHNALHSLQLDQLYVIYPGEKSYVLQDKMMVIGLKEAVGLTFSP